MGWQKTSGRWVVRLGAVAWCLLAAPLALAQESYRCELSLDCLAQMSPCQLAQIYHHAEPGLPPTGYLPGRAIFLPDAFLSGPRSRMTNFFWRGKHFHPEDCTLTNQWCCVKAVKARVYGGPSWFDGKPSLILDYQGMSHVMGDVRDEVRQIGPGLYLGLMYERRQPCPKFKMFFALEAPCCGVSCP